jgi:hypothetical protein
MSYRFSIFIAALAFVWVGTCLNKGGNRLLAMDVEDGETYYELCNDAYEAAYATAKAAIGPVFTTEVTNVPTDLNNHPNTNEREEIIVGTTKHHPAGFNNPNEVANETPETNARVLATTAQGDLDAAKDAETFVEELNGAFREEKMHSKDGDALNMTNPDAEAETGNGTQGEW